MLKPDIFATSLNSKKYLQFGCRISLHVPCDTHIKKKIVPLNRIKGLILLMKNSPFLLSRN